MTLSTKKDIHYYIDYIFTQNYQNIEKKKAFTSFLHELAYQKKIILDSPIVAGIIVTDRCNLSCSHCFNDNRASREGTTEEIKVLIDKLADAEVISLYFTGGEPFLRNDLEELVYYAKQYRFFLTIHTNGILLNRNRIQKLAKVLDPTEDEIQVSIDGSTPEIFTRMRDGDFYHIISNCQLLNEYGISLKINVTVTNHNYDDLVGIYWLATKLKAKMIAFSPLLLTNRNDLTYTYLPSSDILLNSFIDVLKFAEKLRYPVKICQDPIAVPWGIPGLQQILLEKPDITPRYYCPAGTSAIEIDVNGNVYPCPYLRMEKFKAGNLHEKPLKEIWEKGLGWDPFRSAYLGETIKCHSCLMQKYCRGGCPAQAYHCGLSINDADPRCDIILSEKK